MPGAVSFPFQILNFKLDKKIGRLLQTAIRFYERELVKASLHSLHGFNFLGWAE